MIYYERNKILKLKNNANPHTFAQRTNEIIMRYEKHLEDTFLSNIRFEYGMTRNRVG